MDKHTFVTGCVCVCVRFISQCYRCIAFSRFFLHKLGISLPPPSDSWHLFKNARWVTSGHGRGCNLGVCKETTISERWSKKGHVIQSTVGPEGNCIVRASVWVGFFFLTVELSTFFHSILGVLGFSLFRASPAAYEGSQARGPLGAVAASLHHSHSSTGSEPHLRPIPQLMAMPDPEPTEQGQGLNSHPHG